MKRTIARDIVIALILLIGGSASLMTFFNAQTMLQNEKRQMERRADEYLSNLRISMELPVWTIDRDNIRNIADFHMRNEDMAMLRVLEYPDMTVLYENSRPREGEIIARSGDIVHDGNVIARVELGLSPEGYDSSARKMVSSTFITLLVVLLVATTVTGALLRKILKRPLDELIAGVQRISQGDYNYRMPDPPQEEMRAIVKEVDVMAREVRKREQSLRDLNTQLENEVHERERTEKEALRLRNLLKNVTDSMPSLLVVVDNQGRVTQWNPQAEHETGRPAAEALGLPLAEAAPELAAQADNVRMATATRQPRETLKVPVRRDKHIRYKDITVYPLLSGDVVEGAVVRVDDVTERVRIEEMMVQTEKMMSVGGLAAGMAHEINNPLGGILQAVQNMERRLSPGMPANDRVAEALGTTVQTVRDYLAERKILPMIEGIRDSGVRAARIVQNMLNFSRKSESQMAPQDINALLDDTVELASSDYDLKKQYDFRKIHINREYQADMPSTPCTRTEIEQVILNLLKNSAQAMALTPVPGRKPTITLRTGVRDGHAVIEVRDNGPGMDEATRKRVFEPFFTTKDPGIGTGLGLSVSYFIITNNHGGRFLVDSSPDAGTVFTILLPLR
jgi:PAS domain S-box-containing protein